MVLWSFVERQPVLKAVWNMKQAIGREGLKRSRPRVEQGLSQLGVYETRHVGQLGLDALTEGLEGLDRLDESIDWIVD